MPERATYSSFSLKVYELFWMLSCGISGRKYSHFIIKNKVAESIGLFINNFLPGSAYKNKKRKYVAPSMDTQKDDMEKTEPAYLKRAWYVLVKKFNSLHIFDKLKYYGYQIIAIDGVDAFSTKQTIDTLLHRKHGDKITYFAKMCLASIVSPNYGIGFPVAGLMIKNHKTETETETEIKQKQECEQNALVAVLENIKQLFNMKKTILLLDGLYLNGKVIRLITSYGSKFFITLKDDALARFHTVIEEQMRVNGKHSDSYDNDFNNGTKWTYAFDWCNNVKHNFNQIDTPSVNYLSVIITKYVNGEEKYTHKFAWITNLKLKKCNVVMYQIIARKRWGIETMNNTQKKCGLNITHKYDSSQNAPENFLLMSQIASLIHQVLLQSNCYDKVAEEADYYATPDFKSKVKTKFKPKPKLESKSINENLPKKQNILYDVISEEETIIFNKKIKNNRLRGKKTKPKQQIKHWAGVNDWAEELRNCLANGYNKIKLKACFLFHMSWAPDQQIVA